MARDNVVPIDADAARLLVRRDIRFRWFVAAITALWLSLLVPVLVFTPLPPLGPFAVLALLVVLAEHRFVFFGDETSMSASIIVIVASVFVFADTAPFAGPMLVASVGGLYLPHLAHRRAALLAANVSSFAIASVLAATLIQGLPLNATSGGWRVLGAAFLVVLAYWYANSILIGYATSTRGGMDLSDCVRVQATSEWSVILLAASAAIMAHTASDAVLASLLLAVLIPLVAFDVQVIGTEPSRADRGTIAMQVAVTSASAAALAGSPGSAGALALLLLGAFVGTTILISASRQIHDFLIGYIAIAFAASVSPLLGVPPSIQAGMYALFTLTLLTARDVSRISKMLGISVNRPAALGALIPTRREALSLGLVVSFVGVAGHVFSTSVAREGAMVGLLLAVRLMSTRPSCRPRSLAPTSAPRSSAVASH